MQPTAEPRGWRQGRRGARAHTHADPTGGQAPRPSQLHLELHPLGRAVLVAVVRGVLLPRRLGAVVSAARRREAAASIAQLGRRRDGAHGAAGGGAVVVERRDSRLALLSDVAPPRGGQAAVRGRHADVEERECAAAARGDPGHNVVPHRHPASSRVERPQGRLHLGACLLLPPKGLPRPRVASPPEGPIPRVEQIAVAARRDLRPHRLVQSLDRPEPLRYRQPHASVHKQRPAGASAAHCCGVVSQQRGAKVADGGLHAPLPRAGAALRYQLRLVHIVDLTLHVHQLVVAEQQHQLAAGGLSLRL
mmetsp:Transcript_41111/g.133257  ORF Transcript_41111/g.133257 Transcript_41111/m.133257 type:complete len:306 (+) Transcript_41111:105-1022(+)